MLRPVTGEVQVARNATSSSLTSSSPKRRSRQNRRITRPALQGCQTSGSRIDSLIRPTFSYTDFARQLALKPGATGAIAPSSKSLARKTIRQACLHDAKTVVELGPGTGVFTEEILHNLSCDQRFFAIELNQTFVAATKSRCPDVCVYHDAASTLPVWLEKNNSTHADRIISSLPWTIFDKPEQDEMMQVIRDSLAPGGVFVSIIYLGAKFRARGRHFINNLQHHFSSVTYTPTVWHNLPPSQIIRCVK